MNRINLFIIFIFLHSSIKSQTENNQNVLYEKANTYTTKCLQIVNDVNPDKRHRIPVKKLFKIKLFTNPLNSSNLNKFNLYADSSIFYLKEILKSKTIIIDGNNLKNNLANLQLYKQHINSQSRNQNIEEFSKDKIDFSSFMKLKTDILISQSPYNASILTNNPYEYFPSSL